MHNSDKIWITHVRIKRVCPYSAIIWENDFDVIIRDGACVTKIIVTVHTLTGPKVLQCNTHGISAVGKDDV